MAGEIMNDVSKKLNKIMKESKTSNYKLSKYTNIHKSTIGRYLNGMQPGTENLGKIAKYFNVSISYFLSDTENELIDSFSRLDGPGKISVLNYIKYILSQQESK